MRIEERVRQRTDQSKVITATEFRTFLEFLDILERQDSVLFKKFITAPAASKHHGNYECGLVDHSLNVAVNLLEWRAAHKGCDLTIEDCVLVGMMHDICKADTYYIDTDGKAKCIRELYPHHALRSIDIIERLGFRISRKLKIMILLHMSSWENDEDIDALTFRDKLWLMNPRHVQLVQAMNWADMDAARREENNK